jgi:TolB-like protein/tRNA A-37 threonylcarbamoyl transferase component Bud32
MTMGAEPVCPDCHTELPPGATFCPSCGVRTGTHRIPPRHTVDGLPAALAERYTIQQELGRGGMAIVYLAHDVRHDRSVALKIMLPEIAATLGSDRFLREIQIVAKLSHPNILPLYDSGEADGLLFYVMPYVPGEALRSRLDRERQLPIEDALRITREVVDALAFAHAMGVVHRDIKPENILLQAGHAVVSDFGIARAVSASSEDRLTMTGMAIGSPAYMSPEQSAGDQPIDGRADIYSLGCVLYELLVGQTPFTGLTPQALIARHTLEAVPLPHIVRQTIAPDLEAVILRALAKAPADRFHTAEAFGEALDAVATGRTVPGFAAVSWPAPRRWPRGRLAALLGGGAILAAALLGVWLLRPGRARPLAGGESDPRTVAILYFADESPGGTLGAVADGLTEDLIEQLSPVRPLRVISRNGVAPYRGTTVSRDSIARALRAGTVVDGSVTRAGDSVRIALRLADGPSGVDFARASLVFPLSGVMGARDSVASDVARILRDRIGEEVRLRDRQTGTTNVAAWTLLQRGERGRKEAEAKFALGQQAEGQTAFTQADSLLAAAEAADARWVEPVVLRGWIAYRQSRLSPTIPAKLERIAAGLGHAERALALAPGDAAALELRGTLRYFKYTLGVTTDPAAAAALLQSAKGDLEAAVQADPSRASAHATLSHLYTQTDDNVAVLLAARRAYEADAFLDNAKTVLWRLFTGNYDLEYLPQAQRWCDEGARRFPEDFRFSECRLWVLTTPNVPADVPLAWRLWRQVDSLAPEAVREFQSRRSKMIVGGVLARAGLADSASRVLTSARAGADVDPGLELAWIEAYMRTLLHDDAEAVSLLRRYLAANPPDNAETDRGWDAHWWWRDLRAAPGFSALTAAR